MTRQHAFAFDWPDDMRQENFIVSQTNQAVFSAVTQPHLWPFFCTVIHGAPSAGKTHLCQIFIANTGAVMIDADNLGQPHWQHHRAYAVDNIDQFIGQGQAEEALFHLYNAAKANNDRLLITTTQSLSDLNFILPDLKSRLLASHLITVSLPDESILHALYTKLFNDRQMLVKPDVISYLVTHAERSFDMARYCVQELDRLALANGKAVTIPIVKTLLEKIKQDQA